MKNSTMKNVAVLVLANLMLISLFSCKIGDEQPQRELYEFTQGIDVVTFKKEYNAGDIIFMEINIPGKTFTDLSTNNLITVGNAIFSFLTRAETLIEDPVPSTNEIFDLTLSEGEVEKEDDFMETAKAAFSFGCPEADYNLSFGLQVKEPGNYLLVLNDVNQVSLILFTEANDCSIHDGLPPDNADQAFVRFVFDETDVNLDVFEDVTGAGQDQLTISYRQLLENKYAFFIKVR
jgi:hypothetical protein